MEKLQSDIEELKQQHHEAEENIKMLKQEILKLESENATMRKSANTAETGVCAVSGLCIVHSYHLRFKQSLLAYPSLPRWMQQRPIMTKEHLNRKCVRLDFTLICSLTSSALDRPIKGSSASVAH